MYSNMLKCKIIKKKLLRFVEIICVLSNVFFYKKDV